MKENIAIQNDLLHLKLSFCTHPRRFSQVRESFDSVVKVFCSASTSLTLWDKYVLPKGEDSS